MTKYQEEQLCELWGIASMCAGGSSEAYPSPYAEIATGDERRQAVAHRDRVEGWLSSGAWPGDEVFERVCKEVVDMHETLFHRRNSR